MTDLSTAARPRRARRRLAAAAATVLLRGAAPLLATAMLAACASAPVMPPSVSYRVPNHNVAITSDEAQNYCLQFDRGARYQGLQTTSDGLVAVYTCEAPADAAAVPPATQ